MEGASIDDLKEGGVISGNHKMTTDIPLKSEPAIQPKVTTEQCETVKDPRDIESKECHDDSNNVPSQSQLSEVQHASPNPPSQECIEVSDSGSHTKYKRRDHARVDTGKRSFACEFCDYAARRKTDLVTHRMIHTGKKPLACDLCDYATMHKRDLSIHRMVHTGERPFACDLCDYASIHKRDLVCHKMTHTGERPFACDLCDYSTIYKRELATHRMIHTGEKPFACNFCDYTTIYKSLLATHRMIHTGEKPFACDVCDYSTIYKRQLAIHRMVHTGEKPFACDVCDYTTRHKRNLADHKVIHTGGTKPFACNFCVYTTTRRGHLAEHLTRYHKRAGTSEDPIHIESNAAQRESDVLSHVQLNVVQHASPNPPSQEFIELCSSSDDLSKSSILRKVLTDDTEMPGPSGGPLQFSEQDKSPNDAPRTVMQQFTIENEHSNGHSLDVSKKSDKPSHHQSLIELNEVRSEPQNDCLEQLGVSGMDSQDGGPAVQSQPAVFGAEDQSHSQECGPSESSWPKEQRTLTEKKLYVCICGYKADCLSQLSVHIMNTHGSIKKYACYACDYKASDVRDLVQHTSSMHVLLKTIKDVAMPDIKDDYSNDVLKIEQNDVGSEPSNDPLQFDLSQDNCAVAIDPLEPNELHDEVSGHVESNEDDGGGANVSSHVQFNEVQRTSPNHPSQLGFIDALNKDCRPSKKSPPGEIVMDDAALPDPNDDPLKIELNESPNDPSPGETSPRDPLCLKFEEQEKPPNDPSHLGFIEVCLNNGFSERSPPGEILRDDVALSGPNDDPLKIELNEVKNESPNDPSPGETSPGDPLCLKIEEQDKSSNGPSQMFVNQFLDGPLNGALKLEQRVERGQDTYPSCSFDPASAASSNVEFKARNARDLKPTDVMSHFRNEPSKCSLGPNEKPSYNPSRIELNEVECEIQNDPLQLMESEMGSQDLGLPINAEPEISRAEDNSMTRGIGGDRTHHKHSHRKRLNIQNEKKQFTCDLCDYTFHHRRSLARHKMVHSGGRLFACDVCDYTTRQKFNLVRHMKIHSSAKTSQDPSKAELNVVSCASQCGGSIEVCSKNDSSESFQAEEMETEDIAMPGFGEEPSNDPLQTDRRDEPGGPSRLEPKIIHSENKRFTCEICGYSTNKKFNLKAHVEAHTGARLFACDICDKRYAKRRSLNFHKKIHSERYKCNCCDYKTKYKWHLNVHKSTHAERKPVSCGLCDYRTTTKTYMGRHIMVCHFGEFRYSCNTCDYKTWHIKRLDSHKVIHVTPFACTKCYFRAKNEYELERHMAIYHRQAKEFTCSLCDYKVGEESLLSRHMMSSHADADEYFCYSCDYKASNAKAVEQHILSTHTDRVINIGSSAIVTAPTTTRTLSRDETVSSMCVVAEMPAIKNYESTSAQLDLKEYFCYCCDYRASSAAQVENHILNTHTTTLTPDTAAPSTNLTETPRNSLGTCALSKAGSEEYFCTFCSYKASKIEQVEQHILSRHNPFMSRTATSPLGVTAGASLE